MLHSQKAKAHAACHALLAALPGQVYLPDSHDWHIASTELTNLYHAVEIWSKTCVLTPQCVFEPKTTLDLSNGVKLIKEHESLFAVRSGGHMAVPGAQSVDQGVMISMSNFHTKTLIRITLSPRLGPDNSGSTLAVNGGRYPMVGVGGVLLGGGMGYFAGQRGWSVDDIVGWEVVLADGSIVDVTASSDDPYSDLAWALRGGHNHFGIVTRFDMRTFPAGPAYGGLVAYGAAAEEQFFASLDAVYATTCRWGMGAGIPERLHNFTSIASEHVVFGSTELHDSWIDIPRSLASMATRDDRTLFWAITFKADRRAIDIVTELFYAGAVNELKHVEGLSLAISFQPLTVPYLTASKMKAGNLMGLDPDKDSGHFAGILFPTWKFEKDDEAVYGFTRKAAMAMEEQLRKLDLFNHTFTSMMQPRDRNLFGTHLARLQEIRAKYDPDGFIRDYLQHGFELASPGSPRSHGEL
ncbi:hypothetical protein RRF57_012986 [Xylaria bambusicola]|uniref:FAD-binding PCMH-type domain-containing protein n=1 Tax=Xylaria bambusicola TaxID=326684 RepID=A0AAN7V4T6_9PEZI